MALRGKEIYHCPYCGWYLPSGGRYTGICSSCGRGAYGFVCCRCGHQWKPRRKALPNVCPKCKTPYWNRQRIPLKDVSRGLFHTNDNNTEGDGHDRS